jgi:hypothetical protein
MAEEVKMFKSKNGKVYDLKVDAEKADWMFDGETLMQILDENAKIENNCIVNPYEVLTDIVAFLVNNKIHKSQFTMREFMMVLEKLGDEAGEEYV